MPKQGLRILQSFKETVPCPGGIPPRLAVEFGCSPNIAHEMPPLPLSRFDLALGGRLQAAGTGFATGHVHEVMAGAPSAGRLDAPGQIVGLLLATLHKR